LAFAPLFVIPAQAEIQCFQILLDAVFLLSVAFAFATSTLHPVFPEQGTAQIILSINTFVQLNFAGIANTIRM
jgi:hypothetical protein